MKINKSKKPAISVVMPAFNAENYINEALKSILNQSFKDWELIIVDDGSTDNTIDIIRRFKDKRIKILRQPRNMGLTYALNKGIDAAKGEYIARCDADDLNDKDRFEIQIKYLEDNPDYILVGSNTILINHEGKNIGKLCMPETDINIRKNLIIRNCIIHPSVIYRTNIVRKIGKYRNFFNAGAEEYDLWFRLIRMGKFYNIQKNLIKRRLHGHEYTKIFHIRIEIMALLIRFINIDFLFKNKI